MNTTIPLKPTRQSRAWCLVASYDLEQSLTQTYQGERRIKAAREANRLAELIMREFGNIESARAVSLSETAGQTL